MAKTPPPDETARDELVAYLDGELDPNRAHAVEARLSASPDVRREAETLRQTWELLDHLPRPEPSPDFTHRTLERVAAPAGGSGWRGYFRWAAAGLLAAVVGYGGVSLGLRHPPADPDQQLVKDLHVIQNVRAYEHVDDIDFLRQLANPNDPDLLGDDNQDG
jgi:anti-sigma factor RsiW